MRKPTSTGLLAAATGAVGSRLALRKALDLTRRQGDVAGSADGSADGSVVRGQDVAGSAGLLAPERWNRFNHRGEPVTLLEGPAYAVSAAAAVLLTPGIPGRTRLAGTAAVLGAGALGAYDDLCGNADRRGLRGHLSALKAGELTTGGAKLLGIGALGLGCGALVRRGGLAEKALAGIVIAGAANAVNLLDLRPGRAVKAAALAAVPGLVRRAVGGGYDGDASRDGAVALGAAGLGAAVALLPEDLGESAMLGDAGANALGALLGVAAAAGATRSGLVWRAAALTAVTLVSEKVSFTRLIAACPPLDALDRLGRRPVASARVPAQAARDLPADTPSADASSRTALSADAPCADAPSTTTFPTDVPSAELPPTDTPDPDRPPHDPDARG
jgi:UDP-N-acetylmuramyl pentapeptide phosphotransferase/UDP-N-acetylglucosamine-1-phosphate transferase